MITEYSYNVLRWYATGAAQAGSIGFGALGSIGVPTTQRIGHFHTYEHNDATKITGITTSTNGRRQHQAASPATRQS